jgi:thiol-disulfide isomerase/thioredoxin
VSVGWIAGLGLVLGLLTACQAGASTAADSSSLSNEGVGLTSYLVADRHQAPELSGTSLDGKPLSLRSIGTGSIVVINVWASWCAPCRSESPMLAAAARALRTQGVRFLGLVEEDSPSRAKAYADQLGEIYPSLVDHDGALLSRLTLLPPAGIPSTLVLDRSGRMAARVIGAITRPELDQIVKGLTSSS